MTGLVYLIGAVVTAVAFPVLFARRYPGRRGRFALGVVLGLVLMLLWPVTLWVAVALWLTGFTGTTPRFARKLVFPASALGAVATLVVIGSTAEPAPAPTASTTPLAALPTPAAPPPTTVTTVVDGDTVILSTGRTVRILGIDAPDPAECWGPEAAEFARRTLLGQPVIAPADPTQPANDALGRSLAYLLLTGGRDFSVLAAEGGFARADVYGSTPPQQAPVISAAEARARAAGSGIWGAVCAPPPAAAAPAATSTTVVTTPPRRAAPDPDPDPDRNAVVRPAPRPQPAPDPEPEPQPKRSTPDDSTGSGDSGGSDSSGSGTKPRTGNSGHPCRAGERDGDGDGYCGEGR